MTNNDLIDELRESMRAHTDNTEVPRGFADQARRTARRRSARRAATTGIPLLTAAGVATVLAISAGSSTSSPRGGQTANVSVSGSQIHYADYIVRRVQAQLATVDSDVVETIETGGNGNPGTNVTVTGWGYTDPQSGVAYESSSMATPSGTPIYEQYIVGTPKRRGARWRSTNLDPAQHLYAVTTSVGPAAPTVAQDIQQIKQELNSGQAIPEGHATVDGQRTVKLRMPAQAGGWAGTLYVNSQTYAPVQSFAASQVSGSDPSAGYDTTTERWLPATPTNIANAKLGGIPAGFTHVSQATLQKESPAGR